MTIYELNEDNMYIIRRNDDKHIVGESIGSTDMSLMWHMREIEKEHDKGNVSERAFSHIIGLFLIAKVLVEKKEYEYE